MNKEIADKFLNDNKDALIKLSNLIKEAQKPENLETQRDLDGIKKAKEIMQDWINGIWNISLDDLPEYEDEESIFKTR